MSLRSRLKCAHCTLRLVVTALASCSVDRVAAEGKTALQPFLASSACKQACVCLAKKRPLRMGFDSKSNIVLCFTSFTATTAHDLSIVLYSPMSSWPPAVKSLSSAFTMASLSTSGTGPVWWARIAAGQSENARTRNAMA